MRKIILLFLLLCGGLLNAQISLSEIQDTVGKGYVPITDYDPALATYIQKYMLLQDYLEDSISWASVPVGLHDAVTLAGSYDYITLSGQVITRNQIDLTTDVTGLLPYASLSGAPTLLSQFTDDLGHIEESTTVSDTENIDLTLAGTDISGEVIIDVNANNILTSSASGLLVDKSGDWSGTLDGYEASALLDNTDNQTVDNFSFAANTITLELENDGEAPYTIDLSSLDNSGTDDQTLSLVTNTLSIEDGNSVSLAPYLDNTDNQTLSFSSPNLSISGGNSVDISAIDTDTQLSQEQVEDYVGGMVTGNTETGITVTYQDIDGTLDFVVEDDLSLYDNTTSGFLTAEVDGSTTNELQTISTTGAAGNITLSNGGGTLNLNVDDADASSSNEYNTSVALVGNDLQVTDGGGTLSTSLAVYLDNTDDQKIDVFSFATNTLSLSLESDGETTKTVDLSSLDNSGTDDQTLQEVLTSGNDAGGLDAINFAEVEADEFIGDLRGAVLFKAQAGETLAKGDVVYVSGISGNTTIVSKADADDANKMPAFGVVAVAANSGNPVDIYTFGTLSNLNTLAFSLGDILYVSTTAGQLTATPPTGESALIQNIAKVTRVDNAAGSIKISGAGRTNATPNLNTGRLFVGNASNQAVADGTIYVDIANSEVGINTSSPSATLDVNGDVEIATVPTENTDNILTYGSTGLVSQRTLADITSEIVADPSLDIEQVLINGDDANGQQLIGLSRFTASQTKDNEQSDYINARVSYTARTEASTPIPYTHTAFDVFAKKDHVSGGPATLTGLKGISSTFQNDWRNTANGYSYYAKGEAVLNYSDVYNYYGYYMDVSSVANADIKNIYGLYIAQPSLLGGNIKAYGVYIDDYYDNYFGGNVGIGTSNPSEKLQVEGNILIEENAKYVRVKEQGVNNYTTLNNNNLVISNEFGGAYTFQDGGIVSTGSAGGFSFTAIASISNAVYSFNKGFTYTDTYGSFPYPVANFQTDSIYVAANQTSYKISFDDYTGGASAIENAAIEIHSDGTFTINANDPTNKYTLTANDGTNGQVLTTDGAGNVTFQTIAGSTDGNGIFDGTNDGSTVPTAFDVGITDDLNFASGLLLLDNVIQRRVVVNDNQNLDVDFIVKTGAFSDAFFLNGNNGQITLGRYGTGAVTGTETYILGVETDGRIVEVGLSDLDQTLAEVLTLSNDASLLSIDNLSNLTLANNIIHDEDTDTKISFGGGENNIDFTAGGVLGLRFETGLSSFNIGGANHDFRIDGQTADNILRVNASANNIGFNGINATSEFFYVNGTSRFVDDMGIGGAPSARLDVIGTTELNGTVSVQDDIIHIGDTGTKIGFTPSVIDLNAASVNAIKVKSTEVVVNEDRANVDFRVESQTNENLLLADASANSVAVLGDFSVDTDVFTVDETTDNINMASPTVTIGNNTTMSINSNIGYNTIEFNGGSLRFSNGTTEHLNILSDGDLDWSGRAVGELFSNSDNTTSGTYSKIDFTVEVLDLGDATPSTANDDIELTSVGYYNVEIVGFFWNDGDSSTECEVALFRDTTEEASVAPAGSKFTNIIYKSPDPTTLMTTKLMSISGGDNLSVQFKRVSGTGTCHCEDVRLHVSRVGLLD